MSRVERTFAFALLGITIYGTLEDSRGRLVAEGEGKQSRERAEKNHLYVFASLSNGSGEEMLPEAGS